MPKAAAIPKDRYGEVKNLWDTGASLDIIGPILGVKAEAAQRCCEKAFGLRNLRVAKLIEYRLRDLEIYWLRKSGASREDVAGRFGITVCQVSHSMQAMIKEFGPIGRGHSAPRIVKFEKAQKRCSGANLPKTIKIMQQHFAALYHTTLIVCQHVNAPAQQVLMKTRKPKPTLARQIVAYMLNTALGIPQAKVSILMGIDRSTVSHACAKMEEWRSDPRADDLFEAIKDSMLSMRAKEAA